MEEHGVRSVFLQTWETYAHPEKTLKAFGEQISPVLKAG